MELLRTPDERFVALPDFGFAPHFVEVDDLSGGRLRVHYLVPTRPDDPAADANRKAWTVLSPWDKPLLTAFSDGDAITRGGQAVFQNRRRCGGAPIRAREARLIPTWAQAGYGRIRGRPTSWGRRLNLGQRRSALLTYFLSLPRHRS